MTPSPIRTAVILTAGLGSRFLPMTKAIPKAMLPIVDKPVVQYLVEEAVSSGIERIILVMGPGMEAIQRHFEPHPELEAQLHAKGKSELVPHLNPFEGVEFHYLIQEDPHGDGHAILQAYELLKGAPFAVLFGDDIIDDELPALEQLIELYEATGNPVIASERVPEDRLHLYGVIEPSDIQGRHLSIRGLVEKPAPGTAPSNFGVIGKYVCTAEVLEHLAKNEQGHDGEQRLIDAFRSMLDAGRPLSALEIEGQRFDTGSKSGLLDANRHFAQKHPDINSNAE